VYIFQVTISSSIKKDKGTLLFWLTILVKDIRFLFLFIPVCFLYLLKVAALEDKYILDSKLRFEPSTLNFYHDKFDCFVVWTNTEVRSSAIIEIAPIGSFLHVHDVVMGK